MTNQSNESKSDSIINILSTCEAKIKILEEQILEIKKIEIEIFNILEMILHKF